ncbi:biopolymer transporter ExbD [Ascidiaceihabitans sp.]|uniref:ExbD/TolR family protein n=1 Tax=Ascidiaceihabitans sp. TaxID=1872644 RepID=UPI003298857F
MIHRPSIRKEREPTIALINIVFLMLIFFMVAGTLSAPKNSNVTLVKTQDLEGAEPSHALVIMEDGRLMHLGKPTDVSGFLAATQSPMGTARIMPDQNTPALRMITIARQLRAAGAQRVVILSEKARQ